MDALRDDIRYAVRSLRRNPGFATAGLLTLALGIGATTAVFSAVYGVLLKPLPYPDSARLVRLSEEHAGATSSLPAPMLSNLTFHAWRASTQTLDAFAAYRADQLTLALPDGPARVTGLAVTPSLFPLIGATPQLGRFFRDEEGATGNDAVIVLSHRLWRERFSDDPGIVGRTVMADGRPYVIVGVAREGFSFPDRDTLFWTPRAVRPPDANASAGGRGQVVVVNAVARLRPGATPEQAAAEGTVAARSTIRPMAATLLFGTGGPPVVHVRGVVNEMTARVRPALIVLAAAVVCVLLIACANVANMFLSRGVARQRELTVRAALGASRGRIARQLLTESLVLSSCGGLLGLWLAWALVQAMPALATRTFPRLDQIAIDARVIAFAVAATIGTALISGLLPALRGARFDLSDSLRGGDGASAGGFRGIHARRLRDTLLVVEAAFAVVLLVAATLLARSFIRLTNVDSGYTPTAVLGAQVFVPGADAEARRESTNALVASLVDRSRAIPGVIAAGAGNMMPLGNATMIAGFPAVWSSATPKPRVRSISYIVTPGYAEAVGLRLKAGRFFQETDLASGVRPWIVNEEFAHLYLPHNPVGMRFVVPASGPGTQPPIPERTNEVVGIVGNVLKSGNDSKPQAEHYLLARTIDDARFSSQFQIVVRAAGNPSALAPQMRAAVRDLAPTAAVETETLANRFAESVGEPRFAMTILVTFATLALVLASIGLYGVLSYGVTQRKRELGVRAALGASRGSLVALVIREGLAVTALGLAVGLVAAAALTRLMQGVLFGVTPLDAASFVTAPLVLLPVAVAACLLPASRAARTDPAEALRAN
jgi:putative ABC transport system permease protein